MIAFNIGLISVIHQYELATGIHMSPPSWNSLPLPTLSHSSRLLQSPGLSSLSHTANLQVKIGILHMLLLLLLSPIDGSPPGSPVPGILQARTLEWVVIFFSNAWKWKVKVKSLSRVRLLATPWTAAYQAPPSMGFSRQEYWSGVPLPSLKVGSLAIIILILSIENPKESIELGNTVLSHSVVADSLHKVAKVLEFQL